MALTDLCNGILARGVVGTDDVLALRRVVFDEITVTPDEVEALFRIDEGTEKRVPEWRAFFLEAMTDWLVRQQEPSGYITPQQADWLIARIGADRRVRNGTELELVVRALELADEAPASLSAFGLSLVTRAVVENDGRISADEVQRLRRLVFALSGPGRMAVTREEAAALFDLNDATRGRDNDPGWTDFFMRAVANAVTAAAGWAPPDREESLRRQRWLADPDDGIAEAAQRTRDPIPETATDRQTWIARALEWALRDPAEAVFEERLESRTQAASTAAPVNGEEARWLIDRIGRDGEFDDNERALIAFLREIAPTTDPALQPLIDRLAA
ncbi:hypothetical protein [uncultured Brevundimonas sp.]|mgnify:CR=1 FL=1|uniref:hypothetical protein n=1 Tax=uncultured Brevundimonas sp. TaxID=213418 RepID=UPI0030EBF366|tara:strand:+ start:1060 stop:2049 length:990 start_codon:yes stop_codon:yes gene_type:complete